MEQFPQLIDFWELPANCIYNLNNISDEIKEKIIASKNESYINRLFDLISKHNIDVITVFDREYPESLHHIYDRPKVLYIKGRVLKEDYISLAVVGSRRATSYGKWATEKLVKELVDLGVTIVSGVALGIDSIAHRAALEGKGRTIGVLGNGLDIVYPKRNRDLYGEIASNGAIITEYFLGTPPLAHNFPQRNRIISGLSLGVLVIEAKERSGSLITAQHALEQGKEVFALPGNINSIYSRGTNALIKEGAKLVTDIDDIIEEIYELQKNKMEKKKKEIDCSGLSPLEMKVFQLIKEGPIHADSIAYSTGLDISTVYSILTILELKGMIKEMSGRTFTLL
ncbi:MAG: DNA-protecting protein DprA [Tissierellia bacterium]|nr:DNA-protecting protein DprA [Tissierellia bacterium]